MYSYLMSTSGFQIRFDQAPAATITLLEAKHRVGGLPRFRHAHAPLTRRKCVFLERIANVAHAVRVFAFREREVELPRAPLPHLLMKGSQGRPLLREHQHTGGLAIQPMHQFEELQFGTLVTERFDHPHADAASSVNCDPGRLVDHQQGVILEQHRKTETADRRGPVTHLSRCGDANRRHPQFVAEPQSVFRRNPAAIHPDFPATEDPVNVAFRDALEQPCEVIVDPLPVAFLTNLHRGCGFFT